MPLKQVADDNLEAIATPRSITEANIAVRVLNRMTEPGRPEFRRVA